MSSKHNRGGGSYQRSAKALRLAEMARKREERAARHAYRKEKKMESYLADDENFGCFATQLAKMGLQLRDIPGDGNCLFRALGDQFEGHGRNHFKHRLDVVGYMVENRKDFEPFVEDDIPFDRYVSNLKKMGTYAGNDAIVAFAKLHNVNVVIHQLNSPVWTIRGSDHPNTRELHISYHNGDHYSSVRRLGDNTETPGMIKLKFPVSKDTKQHNGTLAPGSKYVEYYDNVDDSSTYVTYDFYDEFPEYGSPSEKVPEINGGVEGVARVIRESTDVEDHVIRVTGCPDRVLVRQTLEDNFYDVDSTVVTVMQIMETTTPHRSHLMRDDSSSLSSQNTTDSGIWSDNGTASRIFGGTLTPQGTLKNKNETLKSSSTGARPKQKHMSSRDKAKEKKLEKKKRAEERHRLKYLGHVGPALDYSDDEVDTVIAKEMGVLQI